MSGFERIGGRPRLNVYFMQRNLIVPTGAPTITNLVLSSASFRKVVGCFLDDSPLDLGIQFQLMGRTGKRHTTHLNLGSYSDKVGTNSFRHSWPGTIDLLAAAGIEWSKCTETTMQIGTIPTLLSPAEATTTGKGESWTRIKTGTNSVIMIYSETPMNGLPHRGLVPGF
jgi:hypothetical protein